MGNHIKITPDKYFDDDKTIERPSRRLLPGHHLSGTKILKRAQNYEMFAQLSYVKL